MKAAEANFLKFLKKSDQLEIPIYQRTYSWTREQCDQLWGDVVRAAGENVGAHFIALLPTRPSTGRRGSIYRL